MNGSFDGLRINYFYSNHGGQKRIVMKCKVAISGKSDDVILRLPDSRPPVGRAKTWSRDARRTWPCLDN